LAFFQTWFGFFSQEMSGNPVKNASSAGFDSLFCSFDGSGLGYASYFWWDRFNSFVLVFTL